MSSTPHPHTNCSCPLCCPELAPFKYGVGEVTYTCVCGYKGKELLHDCKFGVPFQPQQSTTPFPLAVYKDPEYFEMIKALVEKAKGQNLRLGDVLEDVGRQWTGVWFS